jgi:hypothetical protein
MKNATSFAPGRKVDVLCLGRFAVDFYAQQIGRVEDGQLRQLAARRPIPRSRLRTSASPVSFRASADGLGRFRSGDRRARRLRRQPRQHRPRDLTSAVVGHQGQDAFRSSSARNADMAIAETTSPSRTSRKAARC